jgi:aminoglycoside phosphotransferase (APT) family kinase protein
MLYVNIIMEDNDMDKVVLSDIPSFNKWAIIDQIKKGWSKDKKYYIETKNGYKLLLRISNIDTYHGKKKEFETMKEVSRLGITMSTPVDFGKCGDGAYVYSLLSWIDGDAVDEAIQTISEEKQYTLGVEAGKMLRRFHSIPAPMEQQDWEQRMLKKINYHLEKYSESGIRVHGDEHATAFIQDNFFLLKERPQTYQHGDFHVGNLILCPNGTLGVIDFNRWDYGDPFEEFYKMMLFSRELSIPFAKGQINGYFENAIPNSFFDILALYLADVILYSIVWAIPFGTDDVNGMIKRAKMILSDYDNFTTAIPKWLIE